MLQLPSSDSTSVEIAKQGAITVAGMNRADAGYFESPAAAIGAGGYLRDKNTGRGYHITGTDAKGAYIAEHAVDRSAKRLAADTAAPEFRITDRKLLLRMFDLIPVGDGTGRYTRPGFEGSYKILRERDGTLSVAFGGGSHRSGLTLPPQTFHHGRWDRSRKPAMPIVPVAASSRARAPGPEQLEKWRSAIAKTAKAAAGPSNGVVGRNGLASGFAAVCYSTGVWTSLHRHRADGDATAAVPYSRLSDDAQAVRACTSPDPVDPQSRCLSCPPSVVHTGGKPLYFFPTRSAVDGNGVVVIDGRPSSVPRDVSLAYAEAARLGTGQLLTNRWLLLDREKRLYGLVRTNGQVVFYDGDTKKSLLFDPLQAIVLTAMATAKQPKTATPWTLTTSLNQPGGYRYRHVSWAATGFWKYADANVATVIPSKKEPPAPVEAAE